MSVVIGGGLSGLAAAHYLLKNNVKNVRLLEKSQRLGGWVQSTTLPNGLIFEQGPRTIRPKGEQGANTLDLIEELDLTNKVLPILSNHPAALNRLIYVNKNLYVLPSNLLSLFTSKPPFTKPLVSALFRDLKAPKKAGQDESIYDFVERRLGKEIAEYAISPMICGICAGDAREISVKFIMKSFFEAEQEHGSIVKGFLQNMFTRKPGNTTNSHSTLNKLSRRAISEQWSVWSLKGGLEEFPKALKSSIEKRGAEVLPNTTCKEITFIDSNEALVKTIHESLEVKHVYSSIPASQLAPLVKRQHPKLSEELSAIPSVTVAVVNLSYPSKVLKHEAFGFLIPPAENIPILGVIYDSCCFPHGDFTVLTAMMGGRWFGKWFGSNPPPGVLYNTAVKHIEEILGITVKPESYKVNVLPDCIPQYIVGHHDRVKKIREYIREHNLPISLIGSSYDGVGINDVIMSAKRAIEVEKWS